MVSFWSLFRRRLRARQKRTFRPAILVLEERDLPSTLLLAPSGSPATISATLGTGVQSQRDLTANTEVGTLNRNGVASTIAAPKTYPGLSVISPSATRTFDQYSFANDQATSVGTTVSFSSNAADPLFITAYTGSFNPQNLGQNYLADPGNSPNSSTVTFSFTVPAQQTLVLVVDNVNAGAGVGDAYSITISPVVTAGGTTTTLTESAAATTAFGTGITFTATVASGSTLATGTVTFEDGGASIGQGTLNASSVATFALASLSIPASPHTISAVYGGDSNNSSSTSNSLTQTVTRGTAGVNLT